MINCCNRLEGNAKGTMRLKQEKMEQKVGRFTDFPFGLELCQS